MPLPLIPGSLIPLAPAGDGEWIGRYYSSQQPADLVRFSLADPHPEAFASLTRVWERTRSGTEDLIPAEDFYWRSVDGLEIQGWLYRARGEVKGTIVHVHGGPTWHSEDWIDRPDPVPGLSRFSRAGAQLSGQHRLWPELPRGHQGGRLGRSRAGGHSHRDRSADRRRDRRAGQGRHHRHLLRRLLLVVGHHPLSARDRRCLGAHLRHDRPGGGLGDDAPRPATLQRRDDGRLAGRSAGTLPRSARHSTLWRRSRGGC